MFESILGEQFSHDAEAEAAIRTAMRHCREDGQPVSTATVPEKARALLVGRGAGEEAAWERVAQAVNAMTQRGALTVPHDSAADWVLVLPPAADQAAVADGSGSPITK